MTVKNDKLMVAAIDFIRELYDLVPNHVYHENSTEGAFGLLCEVLDCIQGVPESRHDEAIEILALGTFKGKHVARGGEERLIEVRSRCAKWGMELAGKTLSCNASIERWEVCVRELCPWVDWKKKQECKFTLDFKGDDGGFLCRAENAKDQEIRRVWARMDAEMEKTHKRDSKGTWQPLPEKQA